MLEVRRLQVVGVVLSLAAIITTVQVWGEPRKDKDLEDFRRTNKSGKAERLFDEGPINRFADQPLSLYQSTTGETLFALQVKPPLQALPARPLDLAVLVDTSASKAMGPLALASKIVELLVGKLKPEDRLALWTVNVNPKRLSPGFRTAKGLEQALKDLAREYPSGTANLKQTLTDVTTTFPDEPGRQKAIVLLGDGQSLANPISAAERVKLCGEMVERQVSFFCVPLGPNLEPGNLHGFANGTGGKVVRLPSGESLAAVVPGLLTAIAEPVLYPSQVAFPATVVESLPTRLPPLRRDTPTLVVGKLHKPGARLEYTVAGKLGGQPVQLKMAQAVPAADPDNFFLMHMVKQWREQKDRPALIQADRALVLSDKQNQLARVDLLSKAEWAMDLDKFDSAFKLFKQVQELDPGCKEAQLGMDLVQKLRDGKITRAQVKDNILKPKGGGKEMVAQIKNGQVVRVARADNVPAGVGAAAPGNKPGLPDNPAAQGDIRKDLKAGQNPEGDALLKDAKARQAVADQEARHNVDEAIRKANRMVQTVPDDAHDLLKRTLDGVRNNPDLNVQTRDSLVLAWRGPCKDWTGSVPRSKGTRPRGWPSRPWPTSRPCVTRTPATRKNASANGCAWPTP